MRYRIIQLRLKVAVGKAKLFLSKKNFPGNFCIKNLEVMKKVWDQVSILLQPFLNRCFFIIDNLVCFKNVVITSIAVYLLFTIYLLLELWIDSFDAIIVFIYTIVVLLPIVVIVEIIIFSTRYSIILMRERAEAYQRRYNDLHRQRLQLLRDLAELRRKGGVVHPDDYYINSVDDFYNE